MARNWEKQLGRLNRLVLARQNEEILEKNPLRPKLMTLQSIDDVKKWLPSIKNDLEFYLARTKVGCYPERKIDEYNDKIDQLKREYMAFVKRLKHLDPTCKIVPWTERSYSRKLESVQVTSGTTQSQCNTKPTSKFSEPGSALNRIKLPILDSKIEAVYKQEQEIKIGDAAEALLISQMQADIKQVIDEEPSTLDKTYCCTDVIYNLNTECEVHTVPHDTKYMLCSSAGQSAKKPDSFREKQFVTEQDIDPSPSTDDNIKVTQWLQNSNTECYNDKPLIFSSNSHMYRTNYISTSDNISPVEGHCECAHNITVTAESDSNKISKTPISFLSTIVNYSSSDDDS